MIGQEEAAHFEELTGLIKRDSERLLRDNAELDRRLLTESRARGTEPADLRRTVLDSVRDRKELRTRLLSHQEQLRVALGETRWAQVVDGLNDSEAMGRVVGRRL